MNIKEIPKISNILIVYPYSVVIYITKRTRKRMCSCQTMYIYIYYDHGITVDVNQRNLAEAENIVKTQSS